MRLRLAVPPIRFGDIIKTFLRSRSLGLTVHMVRQKAAASPARLRWSGRDVLYRPGTTDPFVLYQVLLRRGKKAEYLCAAGPQTENHSRHPGSNIGASIILLSPPVPRRQYFRV